MRSKQAIAVIKEWIRTSNLIQKRKYYTNKQLFGLFCHELYNNSNDIVYDFSIRSFTIYMNKLASSSLRRKNLYRVQTGGRIRDNRFVILKENSDIVEFKKHTLKTDGGKSIISSKK